MTPAVVRGDPPGKMQLAGKVALITGASSGIGEPAYRLLTRFGLCHS